MSEPLPPTDPDAEHLERLRQELERRRAAPVAVESPGSPADSRFEEPASRKGRFRKAGAAGGAGVLLALLAKLKGVWLLLFSKLKFLLVGLKFLKLGKVLVTGLSMVGTIWVYSTFFGFPFALGFVLLIFVHEMGHAAAIVAKGMRASAPVFIPFFGAMIALKDQPRDARVEAEIAIAGPLAGGLASAGCWAAGAATGTPLLLALAYTGFFLNLFNLIPVSPMDGGRIAGAISRWLWVAGLAIAVPLAIAWGHPLLLGIVVLGGIRMIAIWRRPEETAGYYTLAPHVRLAIAVAYFGLAAALAGGAVALHATAQPK